MPFFVVATQNPTHQIGTFPLPESQLDRFLMRIELGYPAPSRNASCSPAATGARWSSNIEPVLSHEELLRLQDQVPEVHVAEPLLDYVQALVAYTRESAEFVAGLSPRAGIALRARRAGVGADRRSRRRASRRPASRARRHRRAPPATGAGELDRARRGDLGCRDPRARVPLP